MSNSCIEWVVDFSIDVELLADAFGAFAECTSLKNNEFFFFLNETILFTAIKHPVKNEGA